jgi:hypothetical protein
MLRRLLPVVGAALIAAACSDNATEPAPLLEETAAQSELGQPEFKRSGWNWSRSSDATVYVVHGINGTDLGLAEMLPVDVSVNGSCVLEGFEFRDIAGPLALPEGTYDIQVKLAATDPCTGPVAIDAPGVAVASMLNASIVAHLDDAGSPKASVFMNDVSRAPGKARIAAHHTANFGAVDILVNGRVAFPEVMNGEQGAAELRPRRYEIAVAVAGTDTRAFEKTLALRPFKLYNAYAVGTPANGTFEVLLQQIPIGQSNGWARR